MISSKDIIKDKLIQQDYYGFTERECRRMIHYDEYAPCQLLRLGNVNYVPMQNIPTDSKTLAKVADRDWACPYFYIKGEANPEQGIYDRYYEAKPYKNGYAIVKRSDTSLGYQFIDGEERFSRYLTEEEIQIIDPATLTYYKYDIDMYLNDELAVEDLELKEFYDHKNNIYGSGMKRIVAHEKEKFEKSLKECRTVEESEKLYKDYKIRSKWVDAVSHMANNPREYLEELEKKGKLRENMNRQ